MAALVALSDEREQAIGGIDEASFYAMKRIGYQQYNVMSILENSANHDKEHAAQIAGILGLDAAS